jgi:GAF domain-containing protein
VTASDESIAPLFELSRAVAAEKDLPHIFRLSLQAAVQLGLAADAFLFARLAGSASLQLRASHLAKASDPALMGDAREVALRSVRTRISLEEPVPTERGAGRMVAMPVLVGDRPLGCLVVVRTGETAAAFEAGERRRLRAVADQVAVALQVGESFAEQQRRVRELSLLNEVAAECAQLGLDDLLPVVTQHVCKAVGHGLAAVLFVIWTGPSE